MTTRISPSPVATIQTPFQYVQVVRQPIDAHGSGRADGQDNDRDQILVHVHPEMDG